MKVKLAALALATTVGLSANAYADDGKIDFTGNIIEAGCTVDSTLTTPQTVKLGDVAKTAFNGAGTTAANTRFILALSNCPDALKSKAVVVKYDGTPDSTNGDYLQLTGYGTAGVAKGVAIRLLNASGTALPLATSSEAKNISATGDAKLTFFARYIATDAVVSAGTANSTVNFTLAYN
ncbi:fimbrial protein [Escherichia marmotae]|uniref:Fimbrial protein n=1 Tax=Escherichia marmotae TaxID=1499973 RepID=A0A7H9K1T0_9ESCH|nr:fimbrial protein [Escherichia marmotae]QLU99814.1 fimbrial protein [Escherichia marmotae]